MRRRARIEDKLEKLSVGDALEAIKFADVVVVLMDTQAAFEEQDCGSADLDRAGGPRGCVGISKWDLESGRRRRGRTKLRGEADHWLPQVKGAPIVALSGLTGDRSRPADAGIVDALRGLEQARHDQCAQSVVRRCDSKSNPPPGGLGPPPQAQLHHADQGAAAQLCDFLHPR